MEKEDKNNLNFKEKKYEKRKDNDTQNAKDAKNSKNKRHLYKATKKDFLEEHNYEEIQTDRFASEYAAQLQEVDISTHDVWLVQCPKGMDITALENKRVKIPGRRYVGDVQVRATQYATALDQAVGYVNNKGKYALRRLPLAGYISVSKRLNMEQPSTAEASISFPQTTAPPKFKLPVRHPFFGRDFETRIKVNKKKTKALQEADRKSAETTHTLRSTANYYKMRSKLLSNSQTLQQKEHDIRQSVLTGVAPNFMKYSQSSNFVDLTIKEETEVEEEQKTALTKKRTKRKENGVIKSAPIEIKDEAETSEIKKQKRQSNGHVEKEDHKKKKLKAI